MGGSGESAGTGGGPPFCGDGIVQDGEEECDDENATSGDGCSETCTVDGPPSGAFAWYKAEEEDVTVVNATLSDGNEFIKSSWKKTNIAAEGLQPDMLGGSTATALRISGLGVAAMGEVAMEHALESSSSYALKTVRIRARMGKWRYLWLGGPASPWSNTGVAPHAFFDLLDGKTFAPGATATITPLANLWYQCEATLVSGPAVTIGVSTSLEKSAYGGVLEPLAWVEGAEVEQASVSVWRDRIAGRDFMADIPRTWRWVAASPGLGGLPALESQQGFASQLQAGAPEDWSFLHDGSGGSFVIVQQQATPSKFFGSSLGTEYVNGQGFRFGVASTDAKVWEWTARNDGGEAIFSMKGGSSTGANWLAGTYASAAQPAAQLFENGFLVASAGEVADPSSAPAANPLMLGGPTETPSQRVHEMLVYDRALDGDDIERLRAYFANLPAK
jgi:cysteine-rich repeat protein